jgi:ABC-2 type transport system permease protein
VSDELAFRSVFVKTLWERRRGLLFWSLGVGLLVVAVLSVWPSVHDEYAKLVQNYPEGLLAFLGVDRAGLASAPGYLQAELFGLMVPLMLVGYAIAAGSATIAGEEEHGTLEMLLAQPVSRVRVVLQKYAAIVTALAVLTAAFAAVLLVATPVFDLSVGVVDELAATVSAFLLGALFGAVALALGCATGHRATAAGVASALAVGAYLLTSLAGLVNGLRKFRPLSPFWWYSGNNPLTKGLSPLHVSLLLAVTVCTVATAAFTFTRRDVG